MAPELLAPPYPYGAANAHLAFFRVAEVTCVAYLTIIQMHGAGEMLRSFDEDFRVDLTSESGSRDKRLAAARAVVDVAIQVVAELDRPDSVSPKEALRVSLPVSIPFIFPCEASHFLNLTKLIRNAGQYSWIGVAAVLIECSNEPGRPARPSSEPGSSSEPDLPPLPSSNPRNVMDPLHDDFRKLLKAIERLVETFPFVGSQVQDLEQRMRLAESNAGGG